jgi:Flp pilus assembly pilin Flp
MSTALHRSPAPARIVEPPLAAAVHDHPPLAAAVHDHPPLAVRPPTTGLPTTALPTASPSVVAPAPGPGPDEDGSLVTEYGLLAVVAATIAGVVISWASGGALVTFFNALLRHARGLVGA